ncbi:MAG: 2-dehydro-3-deoxygluconokinase [Chloroflexi bacterium]|nr:2-dehydro-3-deoxygluconokinase [Chloroflexota bacterium]
MYFIFQIIIVYLNKYRNKRGFFKEMNKIVTFGEILLRLTTINKERFSQSKNFEITYAGSECNVAVSLAHFNENTFFITSVPDNPIGHACINHVRQFGVNTDYIIKSGERLAVYYLENGASMRASNIVYDRKDSSFSSIKPDFFNWEEIFNDCKLFHFSGITPSLSNSAKKLTEVAINEATKRKIMISCDLNYRSNLWTPEEAQKTMIPLMDKVDILIGGKKDPEIMLGEITKDENQTSYEEMIEIMARKYDFKHVGLSLRESFSADHNDWAGIFYSKGNIVRSKKYEIQIVDRVGAGDAFSAGLIYGIMNDLSNQETLNFAVAASALAHTFHGDYNLATIEEIQAVSNGDISGRIRR